MKTQLFHILLALCFLLPSVISSKGDGWENAGFDTARKAKKLGAIVAIDAGEDHTCAVTSKKTVKCWGSNTFGSLGDGTYQARYTPVKLPGLKRIANIAGGFGHTCALTTSGGAECWGWGSFGQLGDGIDIGARLTPVTVHDLTHAVVLAAGASHTCALTRSDDGLTSSVKCWGANSYGQLGDGTTHVRFLPVEVVGLQDTVALSAQNANTCVLSASGGVKCCGDNNWGQLGNGRTTNSPYPVDVIGLDSVFAIAVGATFACAVTVPERDLPLAGATNANKPPRSGKVMCWGNNEHGQLGDGTTTHSLAPVEVKGLSDVVSLSAGFYHVCALTTKGRVKCWGRNDYGQVGNGTTEDSYSPVEINRLPFAISLTTGAQHTCALVRSYNPGSRLLKSRVQCWGHNSRGQLGDGTNTNRTSPVNVINR